MNNFPRSDYSDSTADRRCVMIIGDARRAIMLYSWIFIPDLAAVTRIIKSYWNK